MIAQLIEFAWAPSHAGSPAQSRAAMEVAAVVLIPKDVPVVKTLVAQTESPRAVDIAARISGFLDGIAYAEGQLVQESQALFQLDQKPFPPTPPAASSRSRRDLDGTGEL